MLKKCGCGKIPKGLSIITSSGGKWAFTCGDCCGEWFIEFRLDYNDIDSEEANALAVKWWNEAPRK